MNDNGAGCLILVIVLALFTMLGYLMAIHILIDGKPTAMDVYQGKTALEYRIVDGVKVDSTVIWKEE